MFYDFENEAKVNILFSALERCRTVSQNIKWHPEGNVLNHSLQVFHCALKETQDIDLIVAALLHDIGKCVESHGHEKYSIVLVKGCISEKTEWLIDNHMRFNNYIDGSMSKCSKAKAIHDSQWLKELVMLVRWDKRGRNPNKNIEYNRNKIIKILNKFNKEE